MKTISIIFGTQPDAIKAGTAKLTGTQSKDVVKGVSKLLSDRKVYDTMAGATNPFGDGRASERILNFCPEFLQNRKENR